MRVVHRSTGEVGVVSDGMVDTGRGEVPYAPEHWDLLDLPRATGRAERVRVAYEADRQLCALLGMPSKARTEWESLGAEDRASWVERGPRLPSIRGELYKAILGVLEALP